MAAQAIGLGVAAQYLGELGMGRVAAHEEVLCAHLLEELAQRPWLRVLALGPARARRDRMFVVDGVHAHDVGQVLDADGVAVRVDTTARGRCTAGLAAATTRVTVAAYNTLDEIDTMLASLDRVPVPGVDR